MTTIPLPAETSPRALPLSITFRTYGLEFCRMLQAIDLFHTSPRESDVYSVVRCVAGAEGLSLFATNLRSAAAAHLDIEHERGAGMFAIPAAQVKNVLQVFKRKLPKDTAEDEYVLEVTVTDKAITIADVSDLFSRDVLTVMVPPESDERGTEPESEVTMRTATIVLNAVATELPKIDLTAGRWLPPAEVSRVAKAAGILGQQIHLWPVGRMVMWPLGDSFVAVCAVASELDDEPRPYGDAVALADWRDRLERLVDQGVI